ncbi:iron-containing alcohol dehydrogenase [Chromobacterium haemolyticum]|nr:iron-containing alcohol dehydrogenase [Chromobacterium haemolyticum]
MQLQGNWNYPTSIRFGAGRAAELPALCRELGMRRPLLVTDPGLARLPMLARLQSLLSGAGLETALFSDMRPNPVGRDVDAGVAAFRDGRHDGVVAVGGGSARWTWAKPSR